MPREDRIPDKEATKSFAIIFYKGVPRLIILRRHPFNVFRRFTSLQDYGQEKLEKLQGSKAAVIGLGATGSVIAEHLARHGVELVLIDRDYLEEKDLYTSAIYSRKDVEEGLPKAVAAEQHLSDFTSVEAHARSLYSGNVSLLEGADIIMDGTDNLETRFLLSEYSKREKLPWIYTASVGERAYSMLFDQKCFSCVFDEVRAGALETCESAGIMREISSLAGSTSSLKAVRYLAGKKVGEELESIPSGDTLEVESPGCRVCRGEAYPHLDSSRQFASVCGENKYEVRTELDEGAFEKLRDAGRVLADNDYLTRAEVNGREIAVFRSGRAIVEARDRKHAEQFFSEVVGI